MTISLTRKKLWLVGSELAVRQNKTLQSDWKLDVARAHHVLDLEVFKLGRKSELLDYPGIFSSSKTRVLFRLRACAHHLAGTED